MDKNIEELVIRHFLRKNRRERARFELFNEKKRRHFLINIHTKDIFNPHCMEEIAQSVSSPQVVYDLLTKRGAPSTCYVMRHCSPYDGQIVSLEQGLADLVFNGPGLISCIHGRLAYMEGEESARWRVLLMKK